MYLLNQHKFSSNTGSLKKSKVEKYLFLVMSVYKNISKFDCGPIIVQYFYI